MTLHPRLILPLLFLALLLSPVGPARADIAPPPPPAGADIQPGQETTQVRMVSEQVLVDIQPNAYDQPSRAQVTATFQMRNLGTQEERMQARFPLNVLYPMYQSDLNTCAYPLAAPEISDFRAWVDGKAAAVTNTVQVVKDERMVKPDKNVKCWANFAVIFPPGQDVNVEVRYSVEGYRVFDTNGVLQFPYVLLTGAAWKDSIGRAEVTFRAPFELTAQTLAESYPEGGTVRGREITWVFEDFEPQENVSVTVMNPGVWQRIQREQETLAKTPNDGEAWGRLGRWYKEAIRLRRGFRWDAGGPEMYQLSKDAYAKSVALLPKDADWHAGYAELLCWNTQYDQLGSRAEARDDLVQCYDEIRLALSINPRQALALQLLEEMSYYQPYPPGDPLLKVQGSRADYLVLTTTPTAKPEEIVIAEPTEPAPTETAQPTAVVPTAAEPERAAPSDTPVAQPSATPIIIAQAELTETASAVNTAAAKPTDILPTPADQGKGGGGGLCGAGFLPLLAALVTVILRRKVGI